MKIKTKTEKITALLLAFALAFALAPPARADNSPFKDVPPSHWAYSEIMQAYYDGAVGGTGNGAYSPNGNVTMAQFAAILTRVFYPEEVRKASGAGGAWYAPNYSAAEDAGLFENVPDSSPDTEVTREVMAQIMYNLMGSKAGWDKIGGALGAQDKIPDFESVSDSMGTAVATCYGLGLIAGVDASGSFAPKGRMNRAQTAVIYVRLKQAVMEMSGEGESNPGVNPGDTVQQPTQPTQPTQPEQPSVSAAALTNGQPVTEENVLALIEEYKNGKEPGTKAKEAGFTSYMDCAKYPAYNGYSLSPFGKGIECAMFAFAFWDDLFGTVPMRSVTDVNNVRPGDLLQFKTHWAIAVEHSFLYRPGTFLESIRASNVGGGSAGSIGWSSEAGPLDFNNDLVAIYTRYPE